MIHQDNFYDLLMQSNFILPIYLCTWIKKRIMADSTLRKYIWLINTILDGGKLTFNEISDKWDNSTLNYKGTELSKRTFHNHRQAILTELGVDIQCTSMRENSQYYIANREEIEDNDVLKWLSDSMATESLLIDNKSISDKIVLESIPGGREWLPIISKALRDNLRIVFQYKSFHTFENNQTERVLEPLCLKLFKQRWYILGQTVEGKRLIFALDRIAKLELTSECFLYPEDFSAKSFFADFYGICSDGYSQPTRVVLKCYREFPKYIKSLPLHQSQEELDHGDDFTTFGYYMSPAYDFIQEIMSHGDDIEVLTPIWLRDLIKVKIHSLATLYK
ncbi:MAG: WYL domain-containing protein [Bacteroides sp.]|nr:WYL domain-containing protein [Bacteroides sp.]